MQSLALSSAPALVTTEETHEGWSWQEPRGPFGGLAPVVLCLLLSLVRLLAAAQNFCPRLRR